MMKNWIAVFRLRTIPLSISGVLMGAFLAFQVDKLNPLILLFGLLTTIFLQILSNIANDYGDGVKGVDNENRLGPMRGIQSGLITPYSMKIAMIIFGILSLIFGIALLFLAFKSFSFIFLLYFLLGVLAIAAAIKYTVGKNAYGYLGMGDVFVFIFFGLVAVAGSYYLFTKSFDFNLIIPSFSLGMLCTAVLNLNNLRDIENDKASKKFTLVTKIGLEKGKIYHSFLIMGSILGWAFFIMTQSESKVLISMIAFIPLILHLKKTMQNNDSKKFDPELKVVALSTFFLVLLYGFGAFLDVYY